MSGIGSANQVNDESIAFERLDKNIDKDRRWMKKIGMFCSDSSIRKKKDVTIQMIVMREQIVYEN